MPCEVDCNIGTSGFETPTCGSARMPTPLGAVYTPYVSLTVSGFELLRTGNNSSPLLENRAAIKSFEYGCQMGTGGNGMKVEILDEGGTCYEKIVKALNKSMATVKDDTQATMAEFGWIITECNGNSRKMTNLTQTGLPLFFNPLSLQTSLEGGLVKIRFEATDMFGRWFESRFTDNLGDDANKMPLKQSLTELFMEKDPSVNFVKFQNKEKTGEFDFANSDGGKDGPKSTWPTDQKNGITTARGWVNPMMTSQDLGILIMFDPSGPGIVFQENPIDNEECCKNSVGTYIVNGGNCSPVLSFNPTVKWQLGMNAGGGGVGGSSKDAGNGDPNIVKPTIDIEHTGTQSQPAIDSFQDHFRIPPEQGPKTAEAFAAHLEATIPFEAMGGIEAELKIFGDPFFSQPVKLTGDRIAIIVINPFYIGGASECEWLTMSNCNKVLSNKSWLILGASHQISGGSYTTTLKLSLGTPNQNVDASDPIGGPCGTFMVDASTEQPEV